MAFLNKIYTTQISDSVYNFEVLFSVSIVSSTVSKQDNDLRKDDNLRLVEIVR